MATRRDIREVVNMLYDEGGLIFGNFVLKGGRRSPMRVNFPAITCYPKLVSGIANMIWDKASNLIESHNFICGVPYTAMSISTVIAVKQDIPMLVRRKEASGYGKKLIDGDYKAGQTCVIIEDVFTTGCSIFETAEDLRDAGLVVTKAIAFVDLFDGELNLVEEGIEVISVFTVNEILNILKESGRVHDDLIVRAKAYLKEIKPAVPVTAASKNQRIGVPFDIRAQKAECEISRKLLNLMVRKRSNLCVAADCAFASDLLTLAKQVGPHICLLKTHADLTKGFTPDIADDLISLAKQFDFLILEDRKFADEGSTVAKQYSSGNLEVSRWADLVTVHSLPGEGILKAIQAEAEKIGAPRGCFLLAEMSSERNLISPYYVTASANLAVQYPKIVAGLECYSLQLGDTLGMVQLTPGVRRGQVKEDGLKERWITPEEAVIDMGGDVIAVGKGVTAAEDVGQEAKLYQQELWAAYEKRLEQAKMKRLSTSRPHGGVLEMIGFN